MSIFTSQTILITASLVIFLLAEFIASLLFYYYRISRVSDYILIGVTFAFGGLYNLLFLLIHIDYPIDLLLAQQIMHFLYLTIQFSFFIYAIRVKWLQPPVLLTIVGVGWYLSMLFLISQYRLIDLPQTIRWWIFTLSKTEGETVGAAFILSDSRTIVLGWGYDLLISMYRIFSFIIIFQIYYKFDFDIEKKTVKQAYQLWMIAIVFYLVPEIIKIPIHLSLVEGANFRIIESSLTLVSVTVVGFIAVSHSEALLLSSTQLLRAKKLYRLVKNQQIKVEDVSLGMKRIIKYLEQLPPTLTQHIFEEVPTGQN